MQQLEERSWGPYCFSLCRGYEETLQSCLPEPSGKQSAHPTWGRTQRSAGFIPLVLLLGPCGAADVGSPASPARASRALDLRRVLGVWILPVGEKSVLVCCLPALWKCFQNSFFELCLTSHTIPFWRRGGGRGRTPTYKSCMFCFARVLQMTS